jgi:hypothetical protein
VHEASQQQNEADQSAPTNARCDSKISQLSATNHQTYEERNKATV